MQLNDASPKVPAHETVYRRLREMILCGELEPGQAVTIQGLIDSLGAGMTPVREAIRRLTAEHALEFQGNRRVSVPVLTPDDVAELAYARLALEPQLAKWATAKITDAGIDALEVIDDGVNTAIEKGDVRSYLVHNYEFHATLYAASEARTTMRLADALWLRMGPSLRVMGGRFGTSNIEDRHADAIEGLRARNADAVERAIWADINQGFEQIRASVD